MIKLNMSDVISVLASCRTYLIVLGVIVALAIVASVACMKVGKPLRGLIRGESLVVAIAAITVVANLICFGPMSTLLTLSTGGRGTINATTTAQSNKDTESIAGEGTVLLKNEDGSLPLKKNSAINVFGWAGTDPLYGGSGAGALNDLYEKVSLIQGLSNAGFKVNEDLQKFYQKYDKQRGEYGKDWTLPEPAVDTYDDSMLDNAEEFSDTAMVVLARMGGEGADLPSDMSQAKYSENSKDYKDFSAGESYLHLSKTESDLLDMVCGRFGNVIVVYDGFNPMEMGFLNEYPQIKSAVWCAGPGQTGFNALGRILNGEVNPSGKLPDTIVYDQKSTPWWNNVGDFKYTNMNEFMVDKKDPYMGGAVPTFVNYVEGIYVGYRYYETASDEGLINYDDIVQFPFGYGLSYTTFKQKMGRISHKNGKVSFDVTVTNTGDKAGKDVVEVYYNPPYTDGGIEKASRNLAAFEKTKELQPGESQTVRIEFDDGDMASYDQKSAKAYVLEKGDYDISIQSDSHHVIDHQKVAVKDAVTYDSDSNTHNGDKTVATNRFDYAAGDVKYLSRANHFANYKEATAAPADFKMSHDSKQGFINTSTYKQEKDENAAMPTTGAKNGMELSDLRGKDYDDADWDKLLDQLTINEMQDLIAHGGFQTASAKSVGKISTVDVDGPSALSNNFNKTGSVGFPSAVMIASTWNHELAHAYGADMGAMADQLDASGWYAPSMNLHRSALEGRSYEYFSEDPLVSGIMASQAVKGSAEHGVYAYIKHFALNEQETNRWSMLCSWIQEQSLRELYLKPFEMSVKDGGASAVMSSFNYIGNVWAGGNKQLLTDVLRDEWGFKGFVDTDYFAGSYYMNADQVIAAGGANCLSTFDIGTNFVSDTKNAVYVNYMRRAAHDVLYTVVNSRAYSQENLKSGLENWMKVAIVIDVVIGLLLIGFEVLAIRKYLRQSVSIKLETSDSK